METQTTVGDQPQTPPPAQAAPQKKPRKKRVTKASLSKQIEKQLLEAAPDVLDAYWLRVKEGLKNGDKHIVELVARLFYGDRGPGATNIVSNTLNVTNEQPTGALSLESVVRKLEARDQVNKALPIPTEIRRRSQDSDLPILDAEE